MVYCVVYCRCSDDYDSHMNRNDDPTCAVMSQMTADDVGLGTLYTDRKPNANANLSLMFTDVANVARMTIWKLGVYVQTFAFAISQCGRILKPYSHRSEAAG